MGNKKLRKWVLFTLTLIVCLIFTGCAKVEFSTYHNDDGSIVEQVVITIDETALANNGYDVVAKEHEILVDVTHRLGNLVSSYQHHLQNLYMTNLLGADEFTQLYSGVQGVVGTEWEGNTLTAKLLYADQISYQYFYSYQRGGTPESGSREVIKKPFYVKTIYTGTANYGDFALYNEVYTAYSNAFPLFDDDATTLYYDYKVSSKRIHSDADNITMTDNGEYIHRWKIDKNEPSRTIHLYTIQARASHWIVTCIGLSLLTCLVIFIVFATRKPSSSTSQQGNSTNNPKQD